MARAWGSTDNAASPSLEPFSYDWNSKALSQKSRQGVYQPHSPTPIGHGEYTIPLMYPPSASDRKEGALPTECLFHSSSFRHIWHRSPYLWVNIMHTTERDLGESRGVYAGAYLSHCCRGKLYPSLHFHFTSEIFWIIGHMEKFIVLTLFCLILYNQVCIYYYRSTKPIITLLWVFIFREQRPISGL
jgi:hypothetical protein